MHTPKCTIKYTCAMQEVVIWQRRQLEKKLYDRKITVSRVCSVV